MILENSGPIIRFYRPRLLWRDICFRTRTDFSLILLGGGCREIFGQFPKKAAPVLEAAVGLDSGRAFGENVTIASLIEKEVPEYADRRLVAGILLKRLKAGMPLQVDASVCYAKSRSFENCHPLNREDFKIDSEFNTYRNKGLPPAPVSSRALKR